MINLKHIVHTDIKGEPKSDWKLLRGRKSAKKLPTVMEGGEEVTKSDAGGTAKRWLGGGLAYAVSRKWCHIYGLHLTFQQWDQF